MFCVKPETPPVTILKGSASTTLEIKQAKPKAYNRAEIRPHKTPLVSFYASNRYDRRGSCYISF